MSDEKKLDPCRDSHRYAFLEIMRSGDNHYQYCWHCHTLFDDNRVPVDPRKRAERVSDKS